MDSEMVGLISGTVMGVAGFVTGRAAEKRAFRLSAVVFVSEYLRDLRAWASEAIDVLSEGSRHVPGARQEAALSQEARETCRHRLSALIDRGRLYLPNLAPDTHGTGKPAAYRGLRHPALDLLVAAERILSGHTEFLVQFRSPRAAVIEVKREFVSEMQELLDPRSHNRRLARLLEETRDRVDGKSAIGRLADGDHQDFSDSKA